MTDHDDSGAATEEQATEDEPIADEPTAHSDTANGNDGPNGNGNGPTESSDDDGSTGEKVIGALQWGAFAILILVALIATLRFYFAASNAINEFVTRQYRPLFQAVFNLLILLASVFGLSVLARRIT